MFLTNYRSKINSQDIWIFKCQTALLFDNHTQSFSVFSDILYVSAYIITIANGLAETSFPRFIHNNPGSA